MGAHPCSNAPPHQHPGRIWVPVFHSRHILLSQDASGKCLTVLHAALSEAPVKAILPSAESQGIPRQAWWTQCQHPLSLPPTPPFSVFSPPSLSPSCLSVCLSLWIGQPLFLLVFPGNTVTLLFPPVVSPSHFKSPSQPYPLLTFPLSLLLCLSLFTLLSPVTHLPSLTLPATLCCVP